VRWVELFACPHALIDPAEAARLAETMLRRVLSPRMASCANSPWQKSVSCPSIVALP